MDKKNKQPKKKNNRWDDNGFLDELSVIWGAKNDTIPNDVLGSYTGNPTMDLYPEQDPDDL